MNNGNTVGKIIIGTEVDSSGAKRNLKELNKELDKFINNYVEAKRELSREHILTDEETSLFVQQLQEAEAGIKGLAEATDIDAGKTLELNEQIGHTSARLMDMIEELKLLEGQEVVTSANIQRVEELKKQIEETRKELEKLSGQKISIRGIPSLNKELDKAKGKSNNVFKSIRRWGLALLGVSSAYTLLRKVMSGVLEQNEGLKSTVDAMKQSLYNAFAPVVTKIINLIQTLMTYVNYIWYRLFDHDLFKQVEAASSNTSKNLASGAKSAKEINKQLAGFDEANVLSSNQSAGGGVGSGASSGSSAGALNLKGEIPDWLKKIMDWIDKNPKLSKILFGLAAFTLLGGWQKASGLADFVSNLIGDKNGKGLAGLLNILSLLAIGFTIKVTWEGFDVPLPDGTDYHVSGVEEFGEALKDYSNLTKSKKANNKSNIKSNSDLIKSNLEVLSSENSTNEERERALININNLTKGTYEQATANTKTSKQQKAWTDELYNNAGALDEVYRAGGLTKDQQYKYYKMLNEQLNPTLDTSNALATGNSKTFGNLYDTYKNLDKEFRTKYIIETIFSGENIVTNAINNVSTSLEKLSKKVKNVFNVGQAVKNFGSNIISLFHADGGIVNMPGRGVPIAHFAGEAGREGIVPMDNQQQMALLGQEIAKYVNINNYVTNNIDSRKLNQILKQSENKERLANNW